MSLNFSNSYSKSVKNIGSKVMIESNEENEERVSKVVGIFWDIENCRIPWYTSVNEVVKTIKNNISTHIGSNDYEFGKILNVFFASSCRQISNAQIKRLNALKVDILMASSEKNSADNKLMAKMSDFLNNENHSNGQKLLVLISCDSDFVDFLNSAKMSDKNEVLVFYWNNNCSQQLLNEFNCHKLRFRQFYPRRQTNNSFRKSHYSRRPTNYSRKHNSEHKFEAKSKGEPQKQVSRVEPELWESEDQSCCHNFENCCCFLFSCLLM